MNTFLRLEKKIDRITEGITRLDTWINGGESAQMTISHAGNSTINHGHFHYETGTIPGKESPNHACTFEGGNNAMQL
jgi:hypothetical protein